MHKLDLELKKNEIFENLKEYLFQLYIVEDIQDNRKVSVVEVEQLIEGFSDLTICPIAVTDKHTIFTYIDGFEYNEYTYVMYEGCEGLIGRYADYDDVLDEIKDDTILFFDEEGMHDYMVDNGWALNEDRTKLVQLEDY